MGKLFAFLLATTMLTSCSSQEERKPLVEPESILKSLVNFLVYRENFVRLSEDFTPIDAEDKTIDRGNFLKALATGSYIPLRMVRSDSSYCYKLHPIPTTTDPGINRTIRDWGQLLYSYYQMEGKPLPRFGFTDLSGKTYTAENTKGKIIVIKCWFIGCVPCVKEMPALNKIVEKYQNRRDIEFVSLAMDPPKELNDFLKKREFRYATVPSQRDYLIDRIRITHYPTHIIINKQGLVSRILQTERELEIALEKEVAKS